MALLAYLRADTAVPRSLPGSLALSDGTIGGGSSIRGSHGEHMPSSFSRAFGRSASYQRRCVVRGKHASFFCSVCGEQCAVHPLLVRGLPTASLDTAMTWPSVFALSHALPWLTECRGSTSSGRQPAAA